jgi:hypothetical protein
MNQIAISRVSSEKSHFGLQSGLDAFFAINFLKKRWALSEELRLLEQPFDYD